MTDEIKVHVLKFGHRQCWYMRYTDPETGRRVTRSTEETVKDSAIKAAGKWEDDLRQGRYQRISNPTWAEFRKRFEDEILDGKSQHTFNTTTAAFNRLGELVNPINLKHLTTARVTFFIKELRREKKSEQTIRTYLKKIFWALRWAKKHGMLARLPEVDLPGQEDDEDDAMKGRPITTEEFERMLASIKKAFDPKGKMKNEKTVQRFNELIEPSWRFYLNGLWWGGLRLSESLNLWWDRDDRIHVDLTGRRPLLIIPKGMQKNKKATVHPMAPEFVRHLETVPNEQRIGPVFKLVGRRIGDCRDPEWVGRMVSRIGKAAVVTVDKSATTGRVKSASAHDLRRSFGDRWSTRVMPRVLKKLMRHRRIETTMRYYVGQNAERTADELWEAYERLEAAKVNNQVNIAGSTV